MSENIGEQVQATQTVPDAEPAPAAAPAPPMPTIGRDAGGIKLSTLEDCVRYARYICASAYCPYSKKHGKMTVEDAVVCIQAGAELGLGPMQSIQGIAAINGRPTIWGDAMLAVCQSSRVFDHKRFSETLDGSGDSAVAVCMCARIGAPPVVRRFSVADARKAKLWSKDGPWQEYPMRMLQMRARAFALRDTFSDVLKGMQCREEQMDVSETIAMLDIPTTPSAIRKGLSKPEKGKPDKAEEPDKATTKTTKLRAASLKIIDDARESLGDRFGKILSLLEIDEAALATDVKQVELDKLVERLLQEVSLAIAQAVNGPTDGTDAAT